MLATVCCWLFCWYSSGFSKKKEKGNQALHRSHLKFLGGCNSLGLSAAQSEFPPTSLHMTIIAQRVCYLNTQKGPHFGAHKEDLHFQVSPPSIFQAAAHVTYPGGCINAYQIRIL